MKVVIWTILKNRKRTDNAMAKGQGEKQLFIKHYSENKRLSKTYPSKTGDELSCSGRVCSSCSTCTTPP